jgi:uncharacterized protein (TIGR02265 family)
MTNTTLTKTRVKKITFESVFKGLKVQNNPNLLKELKPLYDHEHPQDTYPAEDLLEFTRIIRLRLYPHLSADRAAFEMGKQTFHGLYKDTVVGGILFSALKVMKPIRTAKLGARLWNDSGVGQLENLEVGPNQLLSHFRNFLTAPYYPIGIAIAGLEVMGYTKVRYDVTILPSSPGLFSHNFDVFYQLEG